MSRRRSNEGYEYRVGPCASPSLPIRHPPRIRKVTQNPSQDITKCRFIISHLRVRAYVLSMCSPVYICASIRNHACEPKGTCPRTRVYLFSHAYRHVRGLCKHVFCCFFASVCISACFQTTETVHKYVFAYGYTLEWLSALNDFLDLPISSNRHRHVSVYSRLVWKPRVLQLYSISGTNLSWRLSVSNTSTVAWNRNVTR